MAFAELVEADGAALTVGFTSPDRATLCATDQTAERAEDRNSGAEATAQARIAVVTRTAITEAGWRSPSSGARVHGASRHSGVRVTGCRR